MSRLYTVSFASFAFTAANGDYDFFNLLPVANVPIELHGLFIANTSLSGDANEDQAPWRIVRGNTTAASGGAAATPARRDLRDPAAVFTARVRDSVPAAAGTPIVLHEDAFNIRVGIQIWWPEGRGFRCDAGQTRMSVRMPEALPADTSFAGTAYVLEL